MASTTRGSPLDDFLSSPLDDFLSSPLDDFPIDRLGLQPLLKIYTQICHIYPMPDDSEVARKNIINTLTLGLKRLTAAFPWVAGKLTTVKTSPSAPEEMYIRPHDETPLFIKKDLRADPDAPTYHALEKANFPINLLPEDLIAPIATFPMPKGDPALDGTDPVFAIQATFLNGGLILCFAAHHGAMDMNSEGRLISLFSRACKGGLFTDQDLKAGNLRRTDAIQLLNDEEYSALDKDLLSPHILPQKRSLRANEEMVKLLTDPTFPLGKCTWANFDLDAPALSTLKRDAMARLPVGAAYISTDDALTAFVWSCISRVRLPRLRAAGVQTSQVARAVDARNFLPVSKHYLGLMSNMTYSTVPLDTLTRHSALGIVSAALRRELEPGTSTVALRTRALASYMDRMPDRTVVSFTATLDLKSGIMLSSWAGVDSYELAFGMGLGTPASVRRPRFTLVESLIYLLPRSRMGDVGVAVCLLEEEMERLKRDDEWAKYAKFVG
ncbi:hypothetical protein ACHAQH_001391 [Verticillium albo-atrum]